MHGEVETPLLGGRITPGVVRIGNTVRRPARVNAEFVQGLLEHLAAMGFDGAPRFLGIDEQGRHVLSYIDGEVPADLGWHDDAVLTAAAGLIRRYHDATADLLANGCKASAPFEIVCHNDLSPCNFVFREARPVALIDFDTAAPGTRLMDLGYVAWTWLDLGNADLSGGEQRRRLRLLLAAYGHEISLTAIKQAILHRQQMLAAEGQASGRIAMAQWARACRTWTLQNL